MPREVEIKFVVPDTRDLRRKLRAAGFRLETPRTHEMNVLYDLPGHPLRGRGELLRLRKYGEEWLLTHKAKGKVSRYKSREETQTRVSDGRSFHRILTALGFSPTFRYEKFRTEWSDGEGQAVVDETPIGTIAELEGPPRWIDRTAKRLGTPQSGYITSSYAEIFQEWKRRTGSPAQEMTFAAVARRPSGSRNSLSS